MAGPANVRLRLPSRPESALIVRQALTGVAACLSLDALETNDLNTAVTEACNNVVIHAYGDEEGPLEVDVAVIEQTIEVLVSDHGKGIAAQESAPGADAGAGQAAMGTGMGLAVILALARRVEFGEPPGGGTEVRMEFPAPGGATLEPVPEPESDDAPPSAEEPADSIALCVAPKLLAKAVLPRVLAALAARAHFTTDRISDVQLIADVLAANVDESLHGSHLRIGVSVEPRALELRVGPLNAGRSEEVVAAAADGVAPVIDRLADFKRVAPAWSGEHEMLELRVLDPR